MVNDTDYSLDARVAVHLHELLRFSHSPDTTLALYRDVARRVDEGPLCMFCGQRGLNVGRFAEPHGTGNAHVGCVDDYEHDKVLP